eukprot:scaffold513_cov22-Tisochrysis_lutea.AAC.5
MQARRRPIQLGHASSCEQAPSCLRRPLYHPSAISSGIPIALASSAHGFAARARLTRKSRSKSVSRSTPRAPAHRTSKAERESACELRVYKALSVAASPPEPIPRYARYRAWITARASRPLTRQEGSSKYRGTYPRLPFKEANQYPLAGSAPGRMRSTSPRRKARSPVLNGENSQGATTFTSSGWMKVAGTNPTFDGSTDRAARSHP